MKTDCSISSKARFSHEVVETSPTAFTIIELLVVLAVLALMVSLFATARAGSRPNIQGEVCLNNLRQMMAAFTMYTHDNSDLFPPNWDSTTCSWVGDNESGWMPVGSVGSSDAGNPDILEPEA